MVGHRAGVSKLLVGVGIPPPTPHSPDATHTLHWNWVQEPKRCCFGGGRERQQCLKGSWERVGPWETSWYAPWERSIAAVQATAKGGSINRVRSSCERDA